MRTTRPRTYTKQDRWTDLERALEKIPTRSGVCRHECAHTLVAFLLGSDIRRVVVRRDMSKLSHGQLGGWLECGRTGDHFKDMTIDLAGEAADRIFSNGDPSPPTWERPDREKVGPTHDLESACTYAAKLPGDPNEQLAKAWARAVELVQKHRATITALAAKLEHQGELSGSEVKTFLHERLRAKPKKAMPKASAPAVMQTLQRTDGYIRRSQPTWDDSIPGGGIFQARRP